MIQLEDISDSEDYEDIGNDNLLVPKCDLVHPPESFGDTQMGEALTNVILDAENFGSNYLKFKIFDNFRNTGDDPALAAKGKQKKARRTSTPARSTGSIRTQFRSWKRKSLNFNSLGKIPSPTWMLCVRNGLK